MTVVRINLTVPAPDGSLAPASGLLRFTPTQRRTAADGSVVLPVRFQADLVDGAVDVDLAPTGAGWVWRIDEHVIGSMTRTVYATVPNAGAVAYSDLTLVDPGTLAPVADPEAAWWAALQDAQLGVKAVVDPDDPEALILHFPSWQADPADDFVLIMPIQEA